MAQDKVFVDGIYSDKKNGRYGDFYTMGIGPKFIEFYETHKDDKGFINCLFTENREGKPYMFLSTPKEDQASAQTPAEIVNEAAQNDDLPF